MEGGALVSVKGCLGKRETMQEGWKFTAQASRRKGKARGNSTLAQGAC